MGLLRFFHVEFLKDLSTQIVHEESALIESNDERLRELKSKLAPTPIRF